MKAVNEVPFEAIEQFITDYRSADSAAALVTLYEVREATLGEAALELFRIGIRGQALDQFFDEWWRRHPAPPELTP